MAGRRRLAGDRNVRLIASQMLFAVQVYEKLDPALFADVQALLDWSDCGYSISMSGQNHGVLLRSKRVTVAIVRTALGQKLT